MRLIGTLLDEKQVQIFCAFLTREGIANHFEPTKDSATSKVEYLIWIENEDEIEEALQHFTLFQQEPLNEKFSKIVLPPLKLPSSIDNAWKIQALPRTPRSSFFLTYFLVWLCVILFIWDTNKEEEVFKEKGLLSLEIGKTSLQRSLLFDYPHAFEEMEKVIEEYSIKTMDELSQMSNDVQDQFHAAQDIPFWRGVYEDIVKWKSFDLNVLKKTPIFEKISKGEYWRFFTPVVLHSDFLHILFNMAWLWIVGKQMELRLRKLRMAILMVIVAFISNLAQYFMGGPFFIGISGVVCGMVGFIWIRQKMAPWEGYPLPKEATYFLFVFIGAMLGLQIVLFSLEFFSIMNLSLQIANTAHIVGALTGMLLAKIPFFSVK